MKDKFKKQFGAALLLALLVMAGIMTVSTGTSLLVMSEIRQSLYLDQSIISFYAAESGVEKALYQVRRGQVEVTDLNNTSEELNNEANYSLYTSNTVNTIYTSLLQDQSYQLDLYDPGTLTALAQQIRYLNITWQGAGSNLEVNWACWGTNGVLGEPQSRLYSVTLSPVSIQLNTVPNCELHRVKITARNAGATNIEITARTTQDGNTVPIPARVQIKGLGEYPSGNNEASRQAILVTMPEKNPLSNLYDYVLYSEADILKDN